MMLLSRCVLVASLTLISVAAKAQTDVQEEIRKADRLNTRCRDGQGSFAETMKVCEERDRQIKVVESRGWCWGPKESPTYQQKWQPCRSEFDKQNWLPLGSQQGVTYYLDLDAVRTKDGLRTRIVASGADVPAPLRNFGFTLDCKGRFRNEVLAEQYRVWENVKPGSMIAEAVGPICETGR